MTLDLDHATVDIWGMRLLCFSTSSVCCIPPISIPPEAPRVRLIIPMTREISAEEYAPVSRMVAKDVGMEMVDDTCHEAARLMYWPSTSSDGEL